jgi:two-component system, chemotaxis family, CheB/CheR fusion protein
MGLSLSLFKLKEATDLFYLIRENSLMVKDELKTRPFPIVAIGYSAGGLEASKNFLSRVPLDTGMAFVFIYHLSHSYKSALQGILQNLTSLPVREIHEGLSVIPDNVYVMPAGKNIEIKGRRFKVMGQKGMPGIIHNIDYFFRSLGFDIKRDATAVILSGYGHDGSIGGKSIKANMGVVLAQDPKDARSPSMPKTAIERKVADIIAPARTLPERIISYHETLRHLDEQKIIDDDKKTFKRVTAYLEKRTKISFQAYESSFVLEHIKRRMALTQTRAIKDYLSLLQEDEKEVQRFREDFLIKLNYFFKNKKDLHALKEAIKKSYNKGKNEFGIWTIGCSSGEEAYTTAIIAHEAFEELNAQPRISILGTDIDRNTLELAESGTYPAPIRNDISEQRLSKYFKKTGNIFQLDDDFRMKFRFFLNNPLTDEPPHDIDLISARDLLKDLKRDVQKSLFPVFYEALNEEGLLFLGSGKNIVSYNNGLFAVLDQQRKIYQVKKKS